MTRLVEVAICACSHCVMNGASEIREALESLQELGVIDENRNIKVYNARHLNGENHKLKAPIVVVEGKTYYETNSCQITTIVIEKLKEEQ